jgi:hypothetical protein
MNRPGKLILRPLHGLLLLLTFLTLVNGWLYVHGRAAGARQQGKAELWDIATAGLGLTDLCIATEARYTRHPAVSDPISPFMNHPGAIEHFPSGSFWAPPDLSSGMVKNP